jgi:hypothetical protein
MTPWLLSGITTVDMWRPGTQLMSAGYFRARSAFHTCQNVSRRCPSINIPGPLQTGSVGRQSESVVRQVRKGDVHAWPMSRDGHVGMQAMRQSSGWELRTEQVL